MSLFCWILSTSVTERKERSQESTSSRRRSWEMKLLSSPVALSAGLSFLEEEDDDDVCREQKKYWRNTGSMWDRLSSSFADTNVVGENISFGSPSPLRRSVRELGEFSHPRSMGDCIIHSLRSWSVRESEGLMLRQRFRSCWGISWEIASAERREACVMIAVIVNVGYDEGVAEYTHMPSDCPIPSRDEALRSEGLPRLL